MSDEITSNMDILSTKKTNTIATNMPINRYSGKVRYIIDCHIFHTASLTIILLLIIPIFCYHCAKRGPKLRNILPR